MRNLFFLILSVTLISSCDPKDPEPENEEEIITQVTLTFTPTGGNPVTAQATDPDGEGPQDLLVIGQINLTANTGYTLDIDLQNTVAGESITDEVIEEADEHMFFFEFTDNIFSEPTGNGNTDSRSDPLIYLDSDSNQLPLGVETGWSTGNATSGSFRIVLKHQPGQKSSTSTVDNGETDVDLMWDITIN